MTVTSQLASALGQREEAPNTALAKKISEQNNLAAVLELVENLQNKNKDIRNDCIKVLYEIGAANPKLIAAYAPDFIGLLTHKDNRLQWGAMTALQSVTLENPKLIFERLPEILAAAEKGTVITKDNLMALLLKLLTLSEYTDDAFALLNEQLLKSLENQLPMYAENASVVIPAKYKTALAQTLQSRINDIGKDSKKARVQKVINKLLK